MGPPYSLVLEDPSHENISKVSSLNITSTNELDNSACYNLPFRHNRGMPPNWYSLDFEEKRLRYMFSGYVST